MPVKKHPAEPSAAKKHHEPITVQRRFLARRRDIIKIFYSIPHSAPKSLDAVPDQEEELSDAQVPNVLQLTGEPRVYVVTLNIVDIAGGLRKRRVIAVRLSFAVMFTLATIPPKPCQHKLHHVALAMMRRWRM